ncbi:MAG: hypothetical protein WCI64_04410 [Chlorobium sp.]
MPTAAAIASLDTFIQHWKAKSGKFSGTYLITPEALVRNNMDEEQGRGGYYQERASTSESQVMMVRGYLRAYQATKESRYLTTARSFADALLKYFFFGVIPSTAPWRSHWIVNAGTAFNSKEEGHTSEQIAYGEAYECWPSWRKLRPNEFATAGDSLHWFITTFDLFALLEAGEMRAKWLNARNAMFREFKLLTDPRKNIPYKGAMPFEYTNKGANLTVNSLPIFRGPYYAGYQDPLPWHYLQDYTAAANTLQFLIDAQAAYAKSTGITGPFAPVYHYDDSFIGKAVKNSFTWEGPDPNTFWGGFQYRPFAATADFWYHCVYSKTSNAAVANATKVCTTFLGWLDAWLTAHPKDAYVPTSFTEKQPPAAPSATNGDKDPHIIALALKGTVLCKRCGANPQMVGRVIPRLYTMLISHQATTGEMAGAFMHDAKTHIFKGFWAGEIMEALGTYTIG